MNGQLPVLLFSRSKMELSVVKASSYVSGTHAVQSRDY